MAKHSKRRVLTFVTLMVAILLPCTVVSADYTWKNVKVVAGGYVPGIIFSPMQKGLAYCRTDIGGFYKWDIAARQWMPMGDWCGISNLMGGESIAADPKDANIVYLAAGMYGNDKAAFMRSRDQGKTFDIIDVPFTMGGNEDGRTVGERLAIDPNSTNILYFGSRHDGLWTSSDSASTWKKVAGFPRQPNAGRAGTGLSFVVFDPSTSSPGTPCKTIYVGSADAGDTHFYRSIDSGQNWEPVPGQPAELLALKAEMDSRGVLYITYANQSGPNGASTGAVWKYETRINKWTNITPEPAAYCGLAVDHQHSGTLLVTTLDHWSPMDDVLRSTDDGKTWKSINKQAKMDISLSPYLDFGNKAPKFGWWISALALDPFDSNHAMYGTGATIYGTHDLTQVDSAKPTHWSVEADGMEETAIICLISPTAGAHLISGFGDIGGFTHDDLTISPAAGMFNNPVFTNTDALAVATANPKVVVRVGRAGAVSPMALSQDGGHSWAPLHVATPAAITGAPAARPGGRGNRAAGQRVGNLVISADASALIYDAGTPQVSADLGATWTSIKGLPGNLRLVADGMNGKIFYAIDQAGGQVYTSTDDGLSFIESPTQGMGGAGGGRGNGSRLASTPGLKGDLWIAGGRTLLHSTDGGKNFESVAKAPSVQGGGLCFGFGKAAPGKSYPALFAAGTLDGVTAIYRSDDVAKSWVRLNDDQHQYGTRFRCLCGDPRVYGRVYFGTDGRGILYGDLVN